MAVGERRSVVYGLGRRAGNSVIEEGTAGTEQTPGLLEVCRQLRFADMFEHADAGDFVVALQGVQFPIIADLYATTIGQPRLSDTLAGQFGLRLTQGHT